jgi:hypothetical protein
MGNSTAPGATQLTQGFLVSLEAVRSRRRHNSLSESTANSTSWDSVAGFLDGIENACVATVSNGFGKLTGALWIDRTHSPMHLSWDQQGRLGNYLNQYSHARAVAVRYQFCLYLGFVDRTTSLLQLSQHPPNHPLLDCPAPPPRNNKGILNYVNRTVLKVVQPPGWGVYSGLHALHVTDPARGKHIVRLHGFYETWRFWHDIRPLILEDATPVHSVRRLVSVYWDELRARHAAVVQYWIVIHVRRGDRSKDKNVFDLSQTYFQKAMQRMVQHIGTDHVGVLVISDDIRTACPMVTAAKPSNALVFCKNQSDSAEVKALQPVFDWYVCATADAVILTMGSFGSWCAHVNGGIVVAYRDWYLKRPTDIRDYFPPNWDLLLSSDLQQTMQSTVAKQS